MREITTAFVHCSYTPADMDIGKIEINQWHLQRGWSGIGYHFVIRRDGTLEIGRPIEKVGAHVKNHNSDSVGICMVGGKPDANFTMDQYKTLYSLREMLDTNLGRLDWKGHRDAGDTTKTCPNFDVKSLLGE